jgi:hypothetical protein
VNLDVSYVPTARERRDAAMYPWFVRLLYAGLVGGALAVAGAGALSRAAARHGEATGAASLAAVGGALLLAVPVLVSLWVYRAQLRREAERRVEITAAHVRVETEGIVTEIPWDRMEQVREAPGLWLLSGRSFCVALPKRAVPPERAAELDGFLRSMAGRRPGDRPG